MNDEAAVADDDLDDDDEWRDLLRPVGGIIEDLTRHLTALRGLAFDVTLWQDEFEERAYSEEFDSHHELIRSAAWGYVGQVLNEVCVEQRTMLAALHVDTHDHAEIILRTLLGEGFIEHYRAHWLDEKHQGNGKHDG